MDANLSNKEQENLATTEGTEYDRGKAKPKTKPFNHKGHEGTPRGEKPIQPRMDADGREL
jgi:hypothetical protein